MHFRLWFTQDAFPNHTKTNVATVIECRTFIPRHEKETLDQMIDRVNQVLTEDPMSGSKTMVTYFFYFVLMWHLILLLRCIKAVP